MSDSDENVENTPGRRAISAMQEIKNDIVFKTPTGVPKRRSKQVVLEEEQYIEVCVQYYSFSIVSISLHLYVCSLIELCNVY